MTRKMIINAVDQEEVRIAILNGRTLEDFDIETRGVEKNKGNIYKATVMAVEPALNAAFVNYGPDKQGFLTASDVHPSLAPGKEPPAKGANIGELLRPKQQILVQVSKDEVGNKGAVLTTYLSLAGRYLVLMPDSDTHGVSRKIDDEETRKRVREAADRLNVPSDMGVIIRTAGKDRTRVELGRDLKVLLRLWENIQKESQASKAPQLIFKEQDVIIRALRDYFTADIDEIVLDNDEAYDRAAEYMHMVMPNQRSALTRYVERRPIFHHYRVEEQLDLIYTPKVQLPSGGSIVIEPTEALVAIDVNSGKQKSQNQEDTATQTNTEAASEVARQLRLRDLGGIIVIDFIDMAQRKNQQKVEKTLKEGLRFDKARVKIGRISRNGTLEITRQRIRSALEASIFDKCGTCHGTGSVLNAGSHAIGILRKLRDRASRGDLVSARIRVKPDVANRLRTDLWTSLQDIERRFNIRLDVQAEHGFGTGQDDYTFETDPSQKAVALEEPNFGPAPSPEDFGDIPAAYGEDEILDEDEALLRELDQRDLQREEDALRTRDEEDEEDETGTSRVDEVRRGGRARRKQTNVTPPRTTEGRRRESARPAADTAEALDIPTFEMVDPRSLNTSARRPRAQPTRSERDGAAAGKRPRSRRDTTGHGRRIDSQETRPSRARSTATETAPKKVSFWRRLFGLGG